MRALLFICMAMGLLPGCQGKPPPVSQTIQERLAVPDFNTQLVEQLELRPAELKGRRHLGREVGPLRRLGATLAWVDPQVGIHLLDIQKPITRRPVDPIPLALLRPKQQPADVALFGDAVVVRTKQGPFALELFTRQGGTVEQPAPPATGDALPDTTVKDYADQDLWQWAGAYQRGHYDDVIAVAGNRVLAWNRESGMLDCWSVDVPKRSLTPQWQWNCPANTDTIAAAGNYLALSVHDTAFSEGARATRGSGVMLYGLDGGAEGPVLYDRWLAEVEEPILGLYWYGHGLLASQGISVHLLQRTLRSRLQVLATITADEQLTVAEAAGRYVWLRGVSGIRVIDLKDPLKPVLMTGTQQPLETDTPFAVHRQALWYLDPQPPAQENLDAPLELQFIAGEGTAVRHPVSALRALLLTAREDQELMKLLPHPNSPLPLPSDIALYAGHAYIPLGPRGVGVYRLGPDARDPLRGAQHLTTLNTMGEVQQIQIAGHWGYLTNYSTGFQILDLRNPGEPRIVPNREYQREGTGFLYLNGRQVLAAGAVLSVARISQPGMLYVDARYDLPAHADGLAVSGRKCYVSCGDQGVFIFDTVEGKPLVVLNHIRTGHSWGRLAVLDTWLYAAREQQQLTVFDVSRALVPQLVQVLDLGTQITAVAATSGEVFVGLRAGDGGGEVRRFSRHADGTLTWLTSHRLPGPASKILLRDAAPPLVVWGRSTEECGVWAMPAANASRMRVAGEMRLDESAPGPWLIDEQYLWSSTDSTLTVREARSGDLKVVAKTEFQLESTIWPDRTPREPKAVQLLGTDSGALAVTRKGWVHLRPTAWDTVATDPFPLAPSERVLAAGHQRVLLWDSDSLTYQLYLLRSDSAPLPLDAQTVRAIAHPDGGGPWEVVDADFRGPAAVSATVLPRQTVVFAAAEAFSGATLYADGVAIDRIPDLQATAVAMGPGKRWAAAGEAQLPEALPRAIAVVKQDGAEVARMRLPGVPRKLLFPETDVLLAVWDWGLTVIGGPEEMETFAGRIEDVQLGGGWDGPGPGYVYLRFVGQPEWVRLEIRK